MSVNLSADVLYWVTLVIFLLTYAALAWGGVPGLRIDRAGIAITGTAAMLVVGSISLADAAASIDAATIALLLGMMIVVAHLQLSGFFSWMTDHIAAKFSGPYSLLAVTIVLSGTLSASNIGSVATITGNPQNIIIGSLSGIEYLRFAMRLAPIAAIGLVVNFFVVALVYRREFAKQARIEPSSQVYKQCVHPRLMLKTVGVTLATIGCFFAGFPIVGCAFESRF